jgi:cobalt-zinc-cadmium efflux system outer membrane protein
MKLTCKGLLAAATILLMFANLRFAALAQESKEPILQLQDLVKEAMENNPQLRAARSQVEAGWKKVDQATAWEAPQIGIEFFQTPTKSFPNPVKDGMETDYFIQQMFPFPGKLSAAGNSAENNAMMLEQGYKALERKVISEVKSAYYDLYLVQRKIRINTDNQELMRQFQKIALKHYEVGTGEHHEALRAQVELSTLINEGIILQKEKRAAEAMLNTLLSRPTDSPLGFVPDPDLSAAQLTFDQLKPIALESRPEVRAMHYAIDMSQSEVQLSKREYFPDLMLRFAYKDMAGTPNNFWSAVAGVSIPLAFWSRGKYSSKVEENELNARKAEEEFNSMKNTTLFEVQDALLKVQTNQNLVQLYKNTVIPQARQTLETTIIAYQTGRSMFLWLIDIYRTLLNAQLSYHQSVMDFMKSQVELERAVGLSMEEIRDKIR